MVLAQGDDLAATIAETKLADLAAELSLRDPERETLQALGDREIFRSVAHSTPSATLATSPSRLLISALSIISRRMAFARSQVRIAN